MTLVSERTVVAQVASQLSSGIQTGRWRNWLPSERALARELQVSRSTLRNALREMHRSGALRAEHGVGNRIIRSEIAPRKRPKRTFAVLAPAPLTQLRPRIALWVDELKDLLHAAGRELRFHTLRTAYRPKPDRALRRLCESNEHVVWILVLSTEAMQHWFQQHGVPCVIAGSGFPGINLPSVDLDYRAIARHAAGVLIRAGHKRVAVFQRKFRGAGEVETEDGFLEAIKQSSQPGIVASVIEHEETVAAAVSALRQIWGHAKGPTGLLIANSHYYLAALTELARRGMRVPTDVSLISRDDDSFLNFVLPEPARYLSNPQVMASKLQAVALKVAKGGDVSAQVRVVPKFEAGKSLGRPKA